MRVHGMQFIRDVKNILSSFANAVSALILAPSKAATYPGSRMLLAMPTDMGRK